MSGLVAIKYSGTPREIYELMMYTTKNLSKHPGIKVIHIIQIILTLIGSIRLLLIWLMTGNSDSVVMQLGQRGEKMFRKRWLLQLSRKEYIRFVK